ncbi:MAG: DUF4954 family protein, partial [Planctomycetota bacterium]
MIEPTHFRPLTKQDIDALHRGGCTASDWSTVQVTDPFKPERLRNTHFSGQVQIGLQSGVVLLAPGVEVPCGIYNATVCNCAIGYNTLIRNVGDLIANMTIADHVVIADVGSIVTEGVSTFGNGTGAAVVNENGGRAIPIYEDMSAQAAYLLAMYRHDEDMLGKLQGLIFEQVSRSESDRGTIESGAHIKHCGVLKNVKIGAGAILEGAARLENGSIVSSPDAPACVGAGVIAKDFIIAEGATVSDNTMLTRCYAGQNVRLEKGFTAVDSVFFANSHFEQGEACSVFAGPFSVSHHKSTLLIAGMFSFYNAGSGTNQSNHMYKLGPVHQGVLERGCKTGSSSHLLWPARVGAFSTIIGKHSKKADLSNLPFSFLLERRGKSELFVGLNLANVGLVRDGKKWPARDHRKAAAADQVNCAVLSPYTAQKMLAGIEMLKQMQAKHPDSDHGSCCGVHVPSMGWGIELYQLALEAYLGDVFLSRIEAMLKTDGSQLTDATLADQFSTLGQLLARKVDLGVCEWADVAGLLAPRLAVTELLEDIKAGRLGFMTDVQMRLEAMHTNYAEYEWAWALDELERVIGKGLLEWSKDEFCEILKRGLASAEKLTALQTEDAGKEFSLSARIGYGVDGDSAQQSQDFEAVCGSIETNKTIHMLR